MTSPVHIDHISGVVSEERDVKHDVQHCYQDDCNGSFVFHSRTCRCPHTSVKLHGQLIFKKFRACTKVKERIGKGVRVPL